MTDGHCFICYSSADALDFATRLSDQLEGGSPKINVWIDKRDLHSGIDWDIQIDEALKNCRIVLFIMTADSANEKSVCKQEWGRALSYKKTVIPLLLQKNIQVPFRLDDRQRIDFTGAFEAGVGQLRRHIAWMDSPAGALQALKDRLADAQRDLIRARQEDQPRIQTEIEDLTGQIQHQQEILIDPQAAQEKTEQNIQSGLVRERQPQIPDETKTTLKFINPPPGIPPAYYQDRFIEEQEIVRYLKDDSRRLLTVVGRGGVGKTALVCRLLKGLESGTLPDDLGEMNADGIVYLSEMGSHRVNFANLFADLSKLLPEETARTLEAIYKNPRTTPNEKMQTLLEAFPGGRTVLLLDNFENLVDPESQNMCDSELREALDALLCGQQHAVKVILTTRIVPRDLAMCGPGRQHVLSLDEGLESPFAENVLREMDADGHVGLKSASDALLGKAREKTRGYPRALEALYMILSVDRYTTLEELLEIKLPTEVVHTLIGQAFSRLDPIAQKVVQALAIFNRPVGPAAIDYLLQAFLPGIDSTPVLNRLVNMHFVRRQAGKYYLHPVDREYAFETIPLTPTLPSVGEPEVTGSFSRHDLLDRAADYFVQARKPPEEWKKLDDLSAQLAEFDLRCEAGGYDTACRVLRSIDSNYLDLWGHYHLLIDLHLRLKGRLQDMDLIMGNIKVLGDSFEANGRIEEAISFYETGLSRAQEIKDRKYETTFFNALGNTYIDLGETRKAIEFYEQALVIAHQIGNRRYEGTLLGNLANPYAGLGEIRKSIDYNEQALIIAREIGDHRIEGRIIGNLGILYNLQGEANKAFEYFKQALAIHQEIGDRRGESIDLLNMGDGLLDLEEYQKSEENYRRAVQIADAISFLPIQHLSHLGMAQVYLLQNNLGEACLAIEAALQYDMPQYNQSTTVLQGIIALRQGERENAKGALARSITQANKILATTPDYYEVLDAKGLALCGLILCGSGDLYGRPDGARTSPAPMIDDAIQTFHAARRIAPHATVVKRVLRLFDELVKCDPNEILKAVRPVVHGQE